MGFLSELTMVQRAGGAAVLVLILVMLLMKQRQAKGAPAATSADAKSETTSKKRESAPKEKKSRSFGSKRKSKGDDLETPVAEPKAGQGRMVPRLPAARETVADAPDTDQVEVSEVAEPAPAMAMASGNGMISEPGWPTPGEVWAAPDTAVSEPAEVGSWQAGTRDDALAALTEAPDADTSEWATDTSAGFEEAAGWDASAADATVPAAESDATWQAEEGEAFDWTAGDAIDGWATSAASASAEDLASGEAAWEAPEDESPSWSAIETAEWEAMEPVAETAAVATAVVEEFSAGSWEAPAETAAAVVADESEAAIETPEIVWDPVDEVEDVEAEMEPVVEVAMAEPQVVGTGPAAEPEMTIVAETPVAHDEPVVEGEPVVMALEAPQPEQVDVEVPVADAVVADPAARWASMAPGGVTESRGTSSPVDSWTRLRPGRTAAASMTGTNGPRTPDSHAAATAVAPMPTAAELTSPSLAWWDVPSGLESDPRRGRFALGGYALQPGHQVVSGVTFRDGVVPPPTHWVIGPAVGQVAPGTLVLHVGGCLNCRPEDLAVLTDPGFAPTTDGFSLRLAAAATGPFAASGTYIIS